MKSASRNRLRNRKQVLIRDGFQALQRDQLRFCGGTKMGRYTSGKRFRGSDMEKEIEGAIARQANAGCSGAMTQQQEQQEQLKSQLSEPWRSVQGQWEAGSFGEAHSVAALEPALACGLACVGS